MEFNQSVSANAGDDGAITYLHEENGNYVSNYMDTLMVYMVQYGTGDLGIVMDEEHKRLLKEIFDEMNSYENTTVTTTIQAGESLGNVVTSAYCSCSICCGKNDGMTASGKKIYNGMPNPYYVACNWLPMGSVIQVDGVNYTVVDRGGSGLSKKGRIDIYTPEGHAECYRRGTGKCEIVIVRLGW